MPRHQLPTSALKVSFHTPSSFLLQKQLTHLVPLSPHCCSPCSWGFILYLLHYQHLVAIVGGSRGKGLCLIHYVFLEATFLSVCIFMCKTKIMTPSSQGHYENVIIDLGTLPSAGYGHSNIVFLPPPFPVIASDTSSGLAHCLPPSAPGPGSRRFLRGLPCHPPSIAPSCPLQACLHP